MPLLFVRLSLLTGIWLMLVGPVLAQLPIKGEFTSDRSEAGWSIEQAGYLTGNRYDPDLAGWLWLTDAVEKGTGTVVNNTPFSADNGLVLTFEFAIWGGGPNGGDGLTVYLFDASQDMAGAQKGQGLGYCKGAGGWLALGLDSLGQFSAHSASCMGGLGSRPRSAAIRGPVADGNPLVGSVLVGEPLGQHMTMLRPLPQQVRLALRPKSTGVGFWVDAALSQAGSAQVTEVFKDLDFPYPAPKQLRLGFAASTKGGKNVHEVRRVTLTEAPTQLPVVPATIVVAPTQEVVAPAPSHVVVPPSEEKIGPAAANIAPLEATIAMKLAFVPSQVKASQPTEMVFTLGSADTPAFTLAEHARLPIDPRLTTVEPLTLGGTCLGTVRIDPTTYALVVETEHRISSDGCTVSVWVRAQSPGTLQITVPDRLIKTLENTTNREANATLVVTE